MPCVGCRVAQPSIAGGDHDLLLRRRRAMEHKPRVDLQAVADLSPVESRAPMRREERLARWVEALEREPKRILRPLHGIEFRKPDERRAIRADNSPEVAIRTAQLLKKPCIHRGTARLEGGLRSACRPPT